MDEFIEVAQRPKFRRFFNPSDLRTLLLAMSGKAIFVEVSSSVEICRDEKDNFLPAGLTNIYQHSSKP